jgi:hypothetical protein
MILLQRRGLVNLKTIFPFCTRLAANVRASELLVDAAEPFIKYRETVHYYQTLDMSFVHGRACFDMEAEILRSCARGPSIVYRIGSNYWTIWPFLSPVLAPLGVLSGLIQVENQLSKCQCDQNTMKQQSMLINSKKCGGAIISVVHYLPPLRYLVLYTVGPLTIHALEIY